MDGDAGTVAARGFTKVYGRGKAARAACRGVDFLALPGQITGLLGPNGAGKTTLLRALCGEQYPTEGSVRVCGTEAAAAIRMFCGFVPETPELDGLLTVRETLCMEAALHGVPRGERGMRVARAARAAALVGMMDSRVAMLSRGYRQRVSLAKALAFAPRVLVLDEFSGGLDPAQSVAVRRALRSMAAGRATILSTHRIEEAEDLCDRLYVMDAGRVVASGTVAEVCAAAGAATLEAAFLALTGRH